MCWAIFGSSRHGDNGWSISLDSPVALYSTKRHDEVLPLLQLIEEAALSGAWVALALSYEAAPAFDRALKTHSSDTFPLVWAAVFKETTKFVDAERKEVYEADSWQPLIDRSDYYKALETIRELIAAGDTYQVNYTFPMTCNFRGSSLAWYRDLQNAQDPGYSVYLDMGRYKCLSLSPELFFERRANRLRAKPMKGTIKRGRWLSEDELMAATLAASEKDRAENVMIVDLVRNDMGKISIPGAVSVPRLFELERYETLWQMTSTVESRLQPRVGLPDIMTALFPCGSITGAPKVRTMEIIRDLEPFPRQVYTGAIGFIRPGGDCIFNVAIRTLLLDSVTGKVSFGVGGGVTADSIAEREYDECLLKSAFLEFQPPPFRLLESILLEGGEFFLLNRHIDRISSSANYFGFHFRVEDILNELKRIAESHSQGEWKIRILLSRTGEIEIETLPLEHNRSSLRVALAAEPMDSRDKFLFHKTTNRSYFNKELTARPDCDDLIFWNERKEITESSIANLVIQIAGKLWTPPQSSGLLAGTLREELLAQGKIQERVISMDELRQASALFLINSVHRWKRATLID